MRDGSHVQGAGVGGGGTSHLSPFTQEEKLPVRIHLKTSPVGACNHFYSLGPGAVGALQAFSDSSVPGNP